MAVGLVRLRTQSATLSPPVSVNWLALTLKSDARARSRVPERPNKTITTTARTAVSGPRFSMAATRAPTSTLPSSAQRTKNLVLSQTHGWSTTRFGTTNHSHIGANQVGNAVGNERSTSWATRRSGTSSEVFQIQNQSQSAPNTAGPSLNRSPEDSQPGWMQ